VLGDWKKNSQPSSYIKSNYWNCTQEEAVSTQVKKHHLVCSLCVDAAVAASQAWLSLLAKVFWTDSLFSGKKERDG
jgi:hypothetical protein